MAQGDKPPTEKARTNGELGVLAAVYRRAIERYQEHSPDDGDEAEAGQTLNDTYSHVAPVTGDTAGAMDEALD